MRKILGLRRGEAGQVLIFVTIILAIASVAIGATLGLTFAGHRSTQIQKDEMQQYYAADTGLENALNGMGNVTFSSGHYTLPDPVNGYNVGYTIQKQEAGTYKVTSTATDPVDGSVTTVESRVSMFDLTINMIGKGDGYVENGNGTVVEGTTIPGVSNTFTYPRNTIVYLQAVADANYEFVEWAGPDGEKTANHELASTTLKMLGDYEIWANFTPRVGGNLTLQVTAGTGGHVTNPGEDTFSYPPHRVVNLLAAPEANYRFLNWTEDTGKIGTIGNVNAAGTFITMEGNYTITANFIRQYQLTIGVNPVGGGTTSPAVGTHPYDQGAVVSLQATRGSGYQWGNWTGDVVPNPSTANPVNVTMDSNKSVVANFQPAPVCYLCFHYAIAAIGGLGQDALTNNGEAIGDIYIGTSGGAGNQYEIDGNLYVKGDLLLEQATEVNKDVHVTGSLSLVNSAKIYGTAYAGGSITLNSPGNLIKGDAWSGGSITTLKGTIDGEEHQNTPPNLLPAFPTFSDPTAGQVAAQALAYKTEAETGGTSGSTTISGGTAANPILLGPNLINGSLIIEKNSYVKIEGTVYVTGTITIENGANIKVADPTAPAIRYAIVSQSTISMENVTVNALGELPIIMSTLSSATSGISVKGSTVNAVLYVPLGYISLQNQSTVYGSVVGKTVLVENKSSITHAPELDNPQGVPPCGCP